MSDFEAETNSENVQTAAAQPTTSGMAIASLILGICSFCAGIFASLPGIILGIISLGKIKKSNGQLKGRGLAIGGIVTASVTLVLQVMMILLLAILMPVIAKTKPVLSSRIDTAKWSEGKTGASTISVALRGYEAEGRDTKLLAGSLTELGFVDGDFEGTYFTDESYTFTVTGPGSWEIIVNPAAGIPRAGAPSNPQTITLSVVNGENTWTEAPPAAKRCGY